MFVQMFTAKVRDRTLVREEFENWSATAGQDAEGWLGTTAGITADGVLVALVRFESEDAARRNSGRAEQDEWWDDLAEGLDGAAEFFESSDVDVDLARDPDTAGFVQVMHGRVSDPARARALSNTDSEAWARYRPEILGSLLLTHPDGEYVMAVYFATEAEAREGEKREPPAEVAATMQEMADLAVGEVTYYDLPEPWLASP